MKRPASYWQRTRRLTLALLALWATVTFVLNWFAPELNDYTFFGFPLGFYMAAQGQMLIFLGIIWFYNRRMDRLDEEYGIREP